MQERASRKRRMILEAAAETFEERGYAGTRLQDIIDRRGVSKGSLYFHFSSKEALALAVVQECRDVWDALIVELREEHTRAMPMLIALSRRLVCAFRSDSLMWAGVRLMVDRQLIGSSVDPRSAAWAGELADLLNEARVQGDLKPDVDTGAVAGFMMAAFIGLQYAANGDRKDLQRCVLAMWRTTLPGLVLPAKLDELVPLLEPIDVAAR
ncbi:ScbR family autoregulator-binding transcription factor [Spirillospora sp. NBC_01491]|nr:MULTISPECIES: ScbR family autoregulator-binding transcription factor [Thermomonosporaceae]MDL4777361.1 ScbR family autoregulator-binding transcription factor [Actinomadura xylanilytica]